MKNLLAIIVVAILATSAMFSANGVGRVNVSVTWPAIEYVSGESTITWHAIPGATQIVDFDWVFRGAKGCYFSDVTGEWTGTGINYFDVSGATLTANGTFNSETGTAGISYDCTLTCKPGTPATTYALTYTVTVDYN